MNDWTLWVQKDLSGRFSVARMNIGGAAHRFFTIEVSGPSEPELPAEPVNYHDFLRWQVRLMDQGYTIKDPY